MYHLRIPYFKGLAVKSLIDGLGNDQCLELTRLFIHDGYGSNIESYANGKVVQMVETTRLKHKDVVELREPRTTSLRWDISENNWLYQDCRDIQLMDSFSVSLQQPHKWIHSRTVFSKWGSVNLDHLKTELGKSGYTEFWRKLEMPKHRYIQIFGTE